ncbi:hypothetical protein GCM10022631_10770 [Deinococcus rubellus]|uniref:hypothetical protein n=1 Tax=Deinococcus rubellus TaxID=1889240 RepID=UPI0031EC5D56
MKIEFPVPPTHQASASVALTLTLPAAVEPLCLPLIAEIGRRVQRLMAQELLTVERLLTNAPLPELLRALGHAHVADQLEQSPEFEDLPEEIRNVVRGVSYHFQRPLPRPPGQQGADSDPSAAAEQ